MSKISPLILPVLLSSFLYAIDLNSTDEIINSAVESTKIITLEIDSAIKNNEINNSINLDNNISRENKEPTVIIENRGDVTAGKNIFKYVIKDDCNVSVNKFAEQYTQEEWEDILEQKQFKEVILKTCPNIQPYYQDRWSDDLYQYFYEISNETEIPEC